MDAVLTLGAVLLFFTTVMALCALLAVRMRRRGTAGSGIRAALAAYEEALHESGHRTHQELLAQADRTAPVTSPDEPRRPDRPFPAVPATGRPRRGR